MANTFTYYPGLDVSDRRVGLTQRYYPLNLNSFIMPEYAGSTLVFRLRSCLPTRFRFYVS